MNETKQSNKSYWAYTTYHCMYDEPTTLIFNTLEEARKHAIEDTLEFEDCNGKDAFMELEENLFFEVYEEDLKDYCHIKILT